MSESDADVKPDVDSEMTQAVEEAPSGKNRSKRSRKRVAQGEDRLVPEPEQEVVRIIEEAVPWRAPVARIV